MKVKDLVKILEGADSELDLCISVETDKKYPYLRVFADDYLDYRISQGEITLLFEGYSNNDLNKDETVKG